MVRCNAYDKYGYYTSYSSSSQRVMQRFCPGSVFLPGDNEQSETPTSQIANLEFKENGQTLRPGDQLHVSFDIPAGFNASWIDVNFQRSGSSIELSWSKWNEEEENTLDYDSSTGHVSGEYTLTADLQNGRFTSIYVYASNSNNESINESFYDGFGFTFTGGVETERPPSPM